MVCVCALIRFLGPKFASLEYDIFCPIPIPHLSYVQTISPLVRVIAPLVDTRIAIDTKIITA
jgi:hypothetical protein